MVSAAATIELVYRAISGAGVGHLREPIVRYARAKRRELMPSWVIFVSLRLPRMGSAFPAGRYAEPHCYDVTVLTCGRLYLHSQHMPQHNKNAPPQRGRLPVLMPVEIAR